MIADQSNGIAVLRPPKIIQLLREWSTDPMSNHQDAIRLLFTWARCDPEFEGVFNSPVFAVYTRQAKLRGIDPKATDCTDFVQKTLWQNDPLEGALAVFLIAVDILKGGRFSAFHEFIMETFRVSGPQTAETHSDMLRNSH